MDKFVVRKKRDNGIDKPLEKERKCLKQATIDSLKGVVVVEEIRRAKAILKQSTTTVDQMLECLSDLEKKIPPRKILLETKIGNVINKLRKHDNEEVRQHARRVYVKWKTHFVEHRDRPQIEVQCDLKTEKTRKAGRKFISEALAVPTDRGLPEIIEREVFLINNRFLSGHYKKTMRNMWFKLKNDQTVKDQVLSSSLSVKEFVQMCSPSTTAVS
ncbi:transcription elongation factor A N-terminal and central domain-containing protein 2-like [Ostrea edulis]|uniref:transcription elongation factor A N-terminal and central domain-containing protein 2-like n=1 Tax=Ostrea edulis TaxID=37623 RepID=UPI0020952784|nr:transcription elongation factor A N-terminal and central domain-containing protein 2-like [Ostrea edulis]